jgi:hypothetical protein
MKCPICGKHIGGKQVADNGWFKSLVVPFHLGRNGKPCSGSGEREK